MTRTLLAPVRGGRARPPDSRRDGYLSRLVVGRELRGHRTPSTNDQKSKTRRAFARGGRVG